MSELSRRRANTVCRACALRKKACDKALPSCAFCTKKNVACRYELPMSKREGRNRRYRPGRNFVVVSSVPPLDSAWEDVPSLAWNPTRIDPGFDASVPSLSSSSQKSVDEVAYRYVVQILELVDMTPEGLRERFLRTFDPSLPILSPAQFDSLVSDLKNHQLPAVDHCVLLLSVLLAVGLPDPQQPHLPEIKSSPSRTTVYMATKALISQAQAAVGASVKLVQANFLIAACEHLSGRPRVAYVSLMSCIGMARMLDVGRIVTQALTVMERIVLCEIYPRNVPPLTTLPNFVVEAASLEERDTQNHTASGLEQENNPFSTQNIDSNALLTQQRQLVSLVDHVLSVTRQRALPSPTLHTEIAELDGKIHNFLSTILLDCRRREKKPEGYSHPSTSIVAMVFRLLFLFHNFALSSLPEPASSSSSSTRSVTPDPDDHQRTKSRATLDSVFNMIVDVAQHRKAGGGKVPMPICCPYNARAALEHLEKAEKERGVKGGVGKEWAVESLREAEGRYWERWGL